MATPYKLRDLAQQVDDLERTIVDTLNAHNGNQTEAAKSLGVSAATLSTYLQKKGYVRVSRYVHESKAQGVDLCVRSS